MPVYTNLSDIPAGAVFDTALRTGAEMVPTHGGDTVSKVEVNDKNSYTTKKAEKTGVYRGPQGDQLYFKAGTQITPGYKWSHERDAVVAPKEDEPEKETRAKNAKGSPENRATE